MNQLNQSCQILLLVAVLLVLAGASCTPDEDPPSPQPAPSDEGLHETEPTDFAPLSEALVMRMLDRNPEWSLRAGRYNTAHIVTIPDSAHRREELEFVESELAALQQFNPDALPAAQRIDHALLENHLRATRWYQTRFLDWQWNPANYNMGGPIGLILNTPYTSEEGRLRTVMARLEQASQYYLAAQQNLTTPTREHTELAITQNRGTLNLLGAELQQQVEKSGLDDAEKNQFDQARQDALTAGSTYIQALESTLGSFDTDTTARNFRLGEELYEEKFRYDIQSGFTAQELYGRALREKDRLHEDMDEIARQIWSDHFINEPEPDDRLERIGQLIDHLSDRHVEREIFIVEIERQIPELATFVRDNDLIDQDPTRSLVVRETPEYMRGGGAGASISAPGPFNPAADTYYNVTPLDNYTEDQAASYLREYNDWVLQILNIHEAIPGHYTQLMHANKSPSLIKSLLRNGAMIEG